MSENLMGASVPDTTRGTTQTVQMTPTEKFEAAIKRHRAEVMAAIEEIEGDDRFNYKAPKRSLAPLATATQQKRTFG